ncbi:AAA family ATPase [Chondromyces apiculatus]|uniref:Uncharacterized protein n=1 Tax=Chondromyces apiculatus DSM 436 TaxID=1192034 RepID=A0A017T070_9BACT|nr:AAA family ATPase [Chondromyces apiculatus]EYF02593.1 Hypothetical protein CAP_6704 [Chondromyces apiculatus DSM 436]
MKISRVVIRELKSLTARDDSLRLDPGGFPASSVCLRGLNGSGKTSYLQAVSSMWRLFRRWTQKGKHVPPRAGDPLHAAGLVALQLTDLPGPERSVWLVYGQRDLWEEVPERGNIPVAGVLASGSRGNLKSLLGRDEPLYRFWDESATKLEQPATGDGAEQIPNMVYIGAEDRFIQPLRGDEDLFDLSPEAAFRFLARYEPSDRKSGHIENSMAALLAVNPQRFEEVSRKLQQVLPRLKLLNRADLRTRRPLVQLKSGAEVKLDDLSAGERAAIIALFTVARWLSRGGVVLIDEPELHQHISLMRSNLAVLERYVTHEMGGQLLVASHAPEVWDHFRINRLTLDLDLTSEEAAS